MKTVLVITVLWILIDLALSLVVLYKARSRHYGRVQLTPDQMTKHHIRWANRTRALAIAAPLAVLGLFMAGCTTLEPNAIRVYGEHVSHASQHFESPATNYGYDTVNVEAHWEHKGAFLDLSEGINLERADCEVNGKDNGYGGLWGPREVFQARIGYEWSIKP